MSPKKASKGKKGKKEVAPTRKAPVEPTEDEIIEIEKLAEEKYKSFEWIWGRSPASEIIRKITFKNQEHKIKIKLSRGAIIQEISIEDNFLNDSLQQLVNQIYKKEELEKILLPIGFIEQDLELWF